MKEKLLVCCLLAGVVVLQGCTTVNPYTREEQSSKATKGAAIGAATGALLGILSGDSSRERKQHRA